MKETSSDQLILNNLKRCVRCGLCLSACPVYSLDKEESSSPRGRIHIIDFINNKKVFKKFLNNCLLCSACKVVCPNDVNIPEIIRDFRSRENIAQYIYYLLKIVQGTNFYKIGIISKLLHIDKKTGGLIRLVSNNRNIPEISSGRIIYNNLVKDKSISIFTGCMSVIFYSGIINHIRKFYENKGYNVYIPEQQVCCGLLNYSAGDKKRALNLSMKNIELFTSNKIEKIITPCASCAYMLRQYAFICDDGKMISNKVVTIDNLIFECIESISLDDTVSIHIPCHIRNSNDKDIYNRLRSLKNIKVIDNCCGNGGVFNIYEYEKSIKIGEILIKELQETKTIYTICSGCYMQLYDIIKRCNLSIEVKSIFELI